MSKIGFDEDLFACFSFDACGTEVEKEVLESPVETAAASGLEEEEEEDTMISHLGYDNDDWIYEALDDFTACSETSWVVNNDNAGHNPIPRAEAGVGEVGLEDTVITHHGFANDECISDEALDDFTMCSESGLFVNNDNGDHCPIPRVESVDEGLESGVGVVGLEDTVITQHGLANDDWISEEAFCDFTTCSETSLFVNNDNGDDCRPIPRVEPVDEGLEPGVGAAGLVDGVTSHHGFVNDEWISDKAFDDFTAWFETSKFQNNDNGDHCPIPRVDGAPAMTVEDTPKGCDRSRDDDQKTTMTFDRTCWFPVSGAECCPDAFTNYLGKSKHANGSSITERARMHLLHTGWKIEFKKQKYRYVSPDGKTKMSLVEACKYAISDDASSLLSVQTPASRLPKRKRLPKAQDPVSEVKDVSPVYCPKAVVDWCKRKSDRSSSGNSREMTLRAKQHLLAVGWRIWYTRKCGDRFELRYTSPSGKTYMSLVTACKACTDEGSSLPVSGQSESTCTESSCSSHSDEILAVPDDRRLRQPLENSDGSQEIKRRKAPKSLGKQRKRRLNDSSKVHVQRSCKRAREAVKPSSIHYTPRTVLSCLIDNNVVVPREKVYYIGRKDRPPMAQGWLTRDGIKCRCCSDIFNLTNFEAHAGSTNHRPAAYIFLEDGRSLMQCQKQMVQKSNLKGFKEESRKRIKSNLSGENSDFICSICHYGGTLVLCDHCPSAFHLSCLGLEDLPEGDWFCPCCRCGICEQSGYDGNTEQFTDKTVLYCDQCEREYHTGCIREKRLLKLEACPKGNWFCSEKCEQIFLGLNNLLGKRIPVGGDNLTWTLLKSSKLDCDSPEGETTIERHSKLTVALDVMHECFIPMKDPYNRRDVVEDAIFNRGSNLSRLNFPGFYTVLLERQDELISVATVRVYGEKVAEVPLVATRFQYRRQGMCRILMDTLEEKLTELGVERLVLPAIPEVVHTWTTKFGFSKMTNSERLKFQQYTFLDFPDTTMCQKPLKTPTKMY